MNEMFVMSTQLKLARKRVLLRVIFNPIVNIIYYRTRERIDNSQEYEYSHLSHFAK